MTTLAQDSAAASPPHRACSSLMVPGLGDDTVSRFVLHVDAQPSLMTPEQMTSELNDQFATRLLRAGIFPNTAGELLHALEQVDPGGPLSQQDFFLVGEGGQLPAEVTAVARNMRFLVTCGRGAEGAEVVVSSFHPDQGMVEVMAWDPVGGGFNFYRTMPDSNAWIFAGNSRHALVGPSRGSGPFESHVNGNIVMKELKVPWVNWHSPFAQIPVSSLKAQGLDQHPWLGRLTPGGAYALEDRAVRPGIVRWSEARVAAIVSGAAVETPARVLEQVVSTLTVNLASSTTTSASAFGGSSVEVDVPSALFVDADMLEVVGLPGPPRLRVSAPIYVKTLTDLNVRLDDGAGFTRAGDTHFAFVVPERPFEDVAVVRAAVGAGLLTRRLVASLLMVDFPNPVFSTRRALLAQHLDRVEWTGNGATYSTAVAEAIIGSPSASDQATAEAEFARNWGVGDDFNSAFTTRLNEFYGHLQAALSSPERFSSVYELIEARRARVREMAIFESALLFPVSDVVTRPLSMSPTATVEEAP